MSSRSYNKTIFKQRVNDYEWPDHQAPPFTTLVKVAYDMYRHLCSNLKKIQVVMRPLLLFIAIMERGGLALLSLLLCCSLAFISSLGRVWSSITVDGSTSRLMGLTSLAS